uniref:Reverse transcriptase Ty1/copia-type domain-containing protein n=1 Tax=Grammatophora oceanica TaxID=210454 RepID=A0A7S1VQI3_9STRA
MFGEPCLPPPNSAIFHWVWIYLIKENPTEGIRYKARAVCDGSSRGGQAQIHGATYAPTPDLTDFRIFVALCSMENKYIFGSDVSNAFAEAPRCRQQYYMRVDTQFRSWWKAKGRGDIPSGYVIPVNKNLQGHPEAPRQFHLHIDKILRDYDFKPTTHAPCLYRGTIDGHDVLFLRQVDDFAIGTTSKAIYDKICDQLDSNLLEPMTRHGLLKHYNGVDILQTRNFITIHCGTYLDKLFESHGWNDLTPVSIPMKADNSYIRQLDATASTETERQLLETQRFRYRGAIGELIWAMVCCRPELSFPVVKLSQFSTTAADIHYDAVHTIFRYLSGTRDHGLTYWRLRPMSDLPDVAPPPRLCNATEQSIYHDATTADTFSPSHLFGYLDSDWAMDIRHRRSISGIIFMLAGAAVSWKCRVQTTPATSSTEAEFLCASDGGRMALHLRSILDELNVPQQYATVLYEDNRGALLMATAGQPTRQSRHIDIRNFALLDWVERDLVDLESISTSVNAADLATKQVGPILFRRHLDNVSGRLRPPWAPCD